MDDAAWDLNKVIEKSSDTNRDLRNWAIRGVRYLFGCGVPRTVTIQFSKEDENDRAVYTLTSYRGVKVDEPKRK